MEWGDQCASKVFKEEIVKLCHTGYIPMIWYLFKEESKKGIVRTTKNRVAIISVFAYGIIFMLLIATRSFRELFGIPEFDLGFNTNMPTLIFTYGAMLYCLNYFVPKFKTTG